GASPCRPAAHPVQQSGATIAPVKPDNRSDGTLALLWELPNGILPTIARNARLPGCSHAPGRSGKAPPRRRLPPFPVAQGAVTAGKSAAAGSKTLLADQSPRG